MKSLFGYGITTKALAKSGGWHIYDDKFSSFKTDEYGNLLLPSNEFDPDKSNLEITSPGISPNNPLIKKARNLISEFDYFYKNAPFQIWITGTNGKTTTTQMTYSLLKEKNADIGGNIGIPLANLKKDAKFWVIEASSFQLYYTKKAKPDIFIILPIKEDHTSWHGNYEEYLKAKLSPLSRMGKEDIVIMPSSLPAKTDAFKIVYENEEDLIKYFGFKKNRFDPPFLLDELLAKAVYKILYFKEKTLENFKIDPHKIEEIYDSRQRLWINDSKATNIDAALNALKRYEKSNILLILGGDCKGQCFKPLFEYLQHLNVKLFLIGKDAQTLKTYAMDYQIPHTISTTLQNAVETIKTLHDNNSVAILSPACASLDAYKSYKHRGEEFKKLINT